ncbi:ATP synthase subunit a [Candidatus Cardinium hertigii]|uniref:ATP synthase subunit a n=2 Tax=Candidatus Cardinium hertigii TaxID=247481 RepID=A0A2Z3L882_9BACT|nr:ATP synthase subunit a [Candidatus Cardinium hertigii]
MFKRCFYDRNVSSYGYGLLLLLSFILPCRAQQGASAGFIMEHVTDAHDWHFATVGQYHVTLPLPIILYSRDRGMECFSSARFYDHQQHAVPFRGYRMVSNTICCVDASRSVVDLSITKNIAAMLGSILLLVAVLLVAARKYQRTACLVPSGFMAFVDLIVSFIKDEIAIPNIGRRHYERFLPYLLTVFCFIWLNNLLGLLPGGANVTGNISVTLVLAAFTIVLTIINGNKQYWSHIFKPAEVPKWLWPIMVPLEMVGIFTKFFSLMVRLFANITAGHIILLSIIGLVFSLKSIWVGFAVTLPFSTFMFLLKLVVAVLQAYVFTLLSAIYLGQAVAEKGCH